MSEAARIALLGPRSEHGCTPDGRSPGLSDTIGPGEMTRRQWGSTMRGSEVQYTRPLILSDSRAAICASG